jgi:excisionase family DNA binding protein
MSNRRKSGKSPPKSGRNSVKPPKGEHALTYSVPRAGKLLGLGRNASYDAVKEGQIPVIRIGGRLLVPKAALQKLLLEAAAPTQHPTK